MPTWDKKCNDCDALFEVRCRIAEKEEIKECPHCGGTDSTYMLSTPTLSRHSERLMTHKADTGGFGQVLDKIKERNPRSNLASGRNSGERAME
jgi:putative FmdB family regulatory protein